jgi:hypothetical protein
MEEEEELEEELEERPKHRRELWLLFAPYA